LCSDFRVDALKSLQLYVAIRSPVSPEEADNERSLAEKVA
jgi:hypothetical protein